MPKLFERGYLIPAINAADIDYVRCAVLLAESIKDWHPNARVAIMSDTEQTHPIFDHSIILPYGDQAIKSQWKLNNDWQVFYASPFKQTIKLEADIVIASPIDNWWTLFEKRDVVVSQGVRTFYDQPATSKYYRKLFEQNNLPDVYNGITYWRFSKPAKDFFDLVRQIFSEWEQYKKLLKFADEVPTTDVVYAMAITILGIENHTLPCGIGPSMVHMKKHIISTLSDDWTKELVWEYLKPGLRIGTIAQWGAVHYHIKDWPKHVK